MIRSLKVSTKLMAAIGFVALVAMLIVGWVAYRDAERTFRTQAIAQLEAVRTSRSRVITAYFERVHADIRVAADLVATRQSLHDLPVAFRKLPSQVGRAGDASQLARFYETGIRPRREAAGIRWDGAEREMPSSLAGRTAQAVWIAGNTNPPADKHLLFDSRHGTDYDRAHAAFHRIGEGLVKAFGLYDILLIGTDGTVVYSRAKEIDFGTNLRTDATRGSGLAESFNASMQSRTRGQVSFVDYRPYDPGFGVAAGFVSAPVFDADDKTLLGVIAFQLTLDEVNAIMTDGFGLGQTGEAYLVGPDSLMRTNSRFGNGTTILRRRVETEAARRAAAGQTGTIQQVGYRGVPVITSFAPVRMPGATWSIVASADVDELLAPIHKFRNRAAFLLLAVSLGAAIVLLLALRRIVLAPVSRLAKGAARVAERKYDQPVNLGTDDELGHLGSAFDTMMSSVASQIDELRRDKQLLEAADAELKESEGRLEAATIGANLGLWDARLETGEILVNDIFERQLGYPALALRDGDNKWAGLRVGLAGWPDFIHPEDRDRVVAAIERQVAGKTLLYRAEHRVRSGDGSWKWILSVGRTAERGEDDRATRVVGVHIDIAELKDMQTALERRYEELRQLEDLRDNLTHMVVHDMRSPLMGIQALFFFLKKEADRLTQDTRETAVDAEAATASLVEMVSSLLDVSRLESGEMPLTESDAELGAVAEDALAALSGLTVGRSVTSARTDGPVSSRCDPELIRRVIVNLLGNALKFTPSKATISVVVKRNGDRPRVEVRDNGPGIPEQFHAKIFDKFGQADGGKQSRRHSSGLGLAFCKLAIEAHGGVIGVESKVGDGSTFWFELPK